MRLAAIAAPLFVLLPLLSAGAQSDRSLTDSDNRIRSAQGVTITVPTPGEENTAELEALQEQILLLRSTIKSLTESLAISNSEAETSKRQAAELTLRMKLLALPESRKTKASWSKDCSPPCETCAC